LPPNESDAVSSNGPRLSFQEVRRDGAEWHLAFNAGGVAELTIPLRPSANYGLLQLDVPAGPHRLYVAHNETAGRRAGDTLSLLGLILIAVVAIPKSWLRFFHKPDGPGGPP
jgi:hypothetical protein